MSSTFPRQFGLAAMGGESAREFDRREDAFQQLAGDGLLAMSGAFAHSYPTKGQDGSNRWPALLALPELHDLDRQSWHLVFMSQARF